ncbi:MAG: hypothetical protein IIC46_09890 [Planctomycetes bacterium]|nr:hypothetical protein [Planctomycetota bacterium]
MKIRTLLTMAVIVVAAASIAMTYADETAPKKTGASVAAAQFEQMKTLVGEWRGTGKHGEEIVEAIISYRLTAAGSVVMETMAAGTEFEMITMYHLNGEELMLTHYCALKNQPRMKATPSSDTSTIAFTYLDGTNMASDQVPHMHGVTFDFLGEDQIKTVWTMHADGAEQSHAKFSLKRVVKE